MAQMAQLAIWPSWRSTAVDVRMAQLAIWPSWLYGPAGYMAIWPSCTGPAVQLASQLAVQDQLYRWSCTAGPVIQYWLSTVSQY